MEYQLTGLQEQIVSVTRPIDKSGRKDFKVNWSFDLDIDVPEDNKLLVRIDAKIHVSEEGNDAKIGHFTATHGFEVFNVPKDFMTANEGKPLFNFLATLIGISLGSMRGLAYARTFNILGSGVFMPIVNPSELLRQNFNPIIEKINRRNEGRAQVATS